MTKFFRKKIVRYDIFFVTYDKITPDSLLSSTSSDTHLVHTRCTPGVLPLGSASFGRLRRSHSGVCARRPYHHSLGPLSPLVAFSVALRGATPAGPPTFGAPPAGPSVADICIGRASRVFLRRLYGSSSGSLRFAAPPIAPGALCGRLTPCSGTRVVRLFRPAGDRGAPPFSLSARVSRVWRLMPAWCRAIQLSGTQPNSRITRPHCFCIGRV